MIKYHSHASSFMAQTPNPTQPKPSYVLRIPSRVGTRVILPVPNHRSGTPGTVYLYSPWCFSHILAFISRHGYLVNSLCLKSDRRRVCLVKYNQYSSFLPVAEEYP